MHGKAQREPARHSVVPDCKLEPLHSTCQGFHAVRLAVSPNAQMYGLGKNSPTVLSRFWTKVHQIRQACRGLPVDWQVFRLLISCSVAEIYSVQIQSRSQKSVFLLPARGGGGKCPLEFGPNFANSSHKWICVQVWLRFVQWPQRLGVKKERRKKKEKPQR